MKPTYRFRATLMKFNYSHVCWRWHSSVKVYRMACQFTFGKLFYGFCSIILLSFPSFLAFVPTRMTSRTFSFWRKLKYEWERKTLLVWISIMNDTFALSCISLTFSLSHCRLFLNSRRTKQIPARENNKAAFLHNKIYRFLLQPLKFNIQRKVYEKRGREI